VAHVRRGRRALQRPRARPGDDGAQKARALDERLSALASYIRVGNYYESAWQLFCYGQLKGLSDEEAVKALAGWCRRHGLEMRFEECKVRAVGVVFVVLTTASI
jgi:hypothetical protein